MDPGPAESQLLDEFREGLVKGQTAPLLVDICIALDTALPNSSDELAKVIREGAEIDPSISAAASLPRDAVGLAMYTANGRLAASNALFHRCVAGPETSAPLAELLARAQTHGRSLGLVPASEEGLVCVLAVTLALGGRWPILQPLLDGRDIEPEGIAVILLSPSRSETAFARSAAAAGLSALEARLAQALLRVGTLEEAAAELGVKRETAKTAMANATRRVGANTCTELVSLLVDVSCARLPQTDSKEESLRRLFGLTQTEARVAVALLAERSVKHTALSLGLSPDTVKAHQRAIFAKTHVHRSRTLRRLVAEALALDALTPLSELLAEEPEQIRGLRILFRPDGRRVAFLDYGPKRAPPLFVGHGDVTGRVLFEPLVSGLQAKGFRPIVVQRPGFGMTTRAETNFLAAAASDMALVLDSLKVDTAHLFMRDGGAATALAFAERYPERVERGVLQNPRQPNDFQVVGANPLGNLQLFLRGRPELLTPISKLMRRQSSAEAIRAILRHLAAAVPADAALISDERVVDFLVSDIHGLASLPGGGFEDERRVFSEGWTPGQGPFGGKWTVFTSGALFPDFDERPWSKLPALTFHAIAGGGTFVQLTHPAQIADLFSSA